MEIRLEDGHFVIGDYIISGDCQEGYQVWERNEEGKLEALYNNFSFEACVVWCLNS